jgi:hypothetical protein
MTFAIPLIVLVNLAVSSQPSLRPAGEIIREREAASGPFPPALLEYGLSRGREYFSDPERQEEYVLGFIAGFKSALADPESETVKRPPDRAGARGFREGRKTGKERARHPRVSGLTLVDFGYVPATVEGFVSIGFERREIALCGGSSPWWLPFRKDLNDRYTALAAGKTPVKVFARLQGFSSPEGRPYGHLGGYPREFVVTEVIELRLARDNDCR